METSRVTVAKIREVDFIKTIRDESCPISLLIGKGHLVQLIAIGDVQSTPP